MFKNMFQNAKFRLILAFLLPVVFIAALVWFFVQKGTFGVLEGNFPPVEKIFFERVVFEPEKITLGVLNDGPESVKISQLIVNDVVWRFKMEPSNELKPLERAKINLYYPWVEGDPLAFKLVSANGVAFEKEVDVSFLSPVLDSKYIKTFVLLGLYVGVIPVLLGLLWFPFLRRLRGGAYMFLLSLTVGLLVFLGFDALAEAIELIGEVPSTFNGVGLLVIGFLLAIFALGVVTYKTQHIGESKGEHVKSLLWAYLIAFGIGLHNLGEGLAIGSAYAIGEATLGATLVIGFMAHNLTEGIAIVSPLTKTLLGRSKIVMHLLVMGILAGAPTIIGSLIGGFAYSPILAILFLAIGVGAIFDVSFDILHYMYRKNEKGLFTPVNVLGFLAGLMIMYGTGFLVLG
ncbi:MAG: metal transporter [Patescibacteria group bacterium]